MDRKYFHRISYSFLFYCIIESHYLLYSGTQMYSPSQQLRSTWELVKNSAQAHWIRGADGRAHRAASIIPPEKFGAWLSLKTEAPYMMGCKINSQKKLREFCLWTVLVMGTSVLISLLLLLKLTHHSLKAFLWSPCSGLKFRLRVFLWLSTADVMIF